MEISIEALRVRMCLGFVVFSNVGDSDSLAILEVPGVFELLERKLSWRCRRDREVLFF